MEPLFSADTPEPAPDALPAVSLRGDELGWQGVSPSLTRVRLLTLAITAAIPVTATAVVGALVSRWVWIATAVLLLVAAWAAWLISRQVSAISWVELPDELVIRKGRVYRRLVSIPYGRLQTVTVDSGPLMRRHGIASLEVHTASPVSHGSVPGLPTGIAEELRARLAAHGEAQRAGL